MTSLPEMLSGRTSVQVPKSRVSAEEIAVVTPTRSTKRVKGRGKTKGQRQPLGLRKIKLPSDYTNRGRLDPVYLWKDGGASFPNKLLSRFKIQRELLTDKISCEGDTAGVQISTSTLADRSDPDGEAR